jgi:hypothetical protein
MRLSNQMEGLISNYHRLIDGYLGGRSYDELISASRKVFGCIDVRIADLGF